MLVLWNKGSPHIVVLLKSTMQYNSGQEKIYMYTAWWANNVSRYHIFRTRSPLATYKKVSPFFLLPLRFAGGESLRIWTTSGMIWTFFLKIFLFHNHRLLTKFFCGKWWYQIKFSLFALIRFCWPWDDAAGSNSWASKF